MKLLYSFLGFAAGIAVTCIFLREAAPTEAAPEGHLDNKQAQEAADLKEEKAVMLQEINALREENVLQADKMAQVKNQVSKQEGEKADFANEEADRLVKHELDKIKAILTLTPQQHQNIEAFCRKFYTFYSDDDYDNGSMEKDIMSVLTGEQISIYEKHVTHKHDTYAAGYATSDLGKYPVTLSLSEDQKDAIYRNLYLYRHDDTREEIRKILGEYTEKIIDRPYVKTSRLAAVTIWAARDVLTEKQMEILLKSRQHYTLN